MRSLLHLVHFIEDLVVDWVFVCGLITLACSLWIRSDVVFVVAFRHTAVKIAKNRPATGTLSRLFIGKWGQTDEDPKVFRPYHVLGLLNKK
jgi:hypothetical protein